MKTLLQGSKILILLLVALFIPVELHATQPIPDNIIYNGIKYHPTHNILRPYIEKNPDKWKWLKDTPHLDLALWRGYIATFEIINNELILKEVEDGKKKSLLKKFLSVSETKDSVFKLDWFTGLISLPGGKFLYKEEYFFAKYFYAFYARDIELHEYHLILEFKNGVLVKETRMDYMEYLSTYGKYFFEGPFPFFLEFFEKLIEYYAETEKVDESEELLAKLKAEYKNMYGKSISDFELTTKKIFLSFGKYSRKFYIIINRTAKGARVKYVNTYYKYQTEIELDTKEWLSLVRILYEHHINEWDELYFTLVPRETSSDWKIEISFTDRDKFTSKGNNLAYPPNWHELKKTMYDFAIKIIRSGRHVGQNQMETQRQF
ncbi:MAG: hypothetical protein LBU89_08375 [Fibromonadaceae bacterium]|nr:hypothetical protein [Fibromonadaceae bacterium]